MAQRKKSLIKEGKLDKHGKPNSNTPKDFLEGYKSVDGASSTAHLGKGDSSEVPPVPATPVKEESDTMDVEMPSTEKKKVKKEKKSKKEKKKKKEKK